MAKIAVIGAGSLVFTRRLVSDLLQQEATEDAEIRLMDLDGQRLREVVTVVEALVQASGKSARIHITTDLVEAVRGVDYVINTIAVGGRKATQRDFDIPERFGIRQTIGDTHGIGGISRAVRTLPRLVELARVIERESPDAWFLNETNPMAMVVMALGRESGLRHVGLCHDAENTARELAGFLELDDVSRLSWRAAGINHMTWFLSLSSNGKDLYPSLRKKASDSAVRDKDPIRFELLERFGYFVSESSVHNAEYYPWFLGREGVAEKFGVTGREHLIRVENRSKRFAEELQTLQTDAERPMLDAQSAEYAPRIVAALESNASFSFMGNVTNAGRLIENLPDTCCVEVPCMVHGGSLVAGHVGRLPEACAALNRLAVNVQLLAVEGILAGNRDFLYQAAYIDPLLSAQLRLDQIRELVDELLDAHLVDVG